MITRPPRWPSRLLCIVLCACAWLLAESAVARDARGDPAIRGAIVYNVYCVVCHGEVGDGFARANKLYSAEQLRLKPGLSDTELQAIIRKGGAGVGRSPYMPPWEDELSEEQTNDVVSYLRVVGAQEARGQIVYQTNCILCHGIKHDGGGRAAVLYDPKPSNLLTSDKPTAYKRIIITMGGEALGRSPIMPPWGLQLSKQEIEDVVYYLDTLTSKHHDG